VKHSNERSEQEDPIHVRLVDGSPLGMVPIRFLRVVEAMTVPISDIVLRVHDQIPFRILDRGEHGQALRFRILIENMFIGRHRRLMFMKG